MTCQTCHGRGYVAVRTPWGLGVITEQAAEPCPACTPDEPVRPANDPWGEFLINGTGPIAELLAAYAEKLERKASS